MESGPGQLPFGLGTYDAAPPDCEEAVEFALEIGYRHVDTAQGYENEAAVGRALEASAVDTDEVVVATKLSSSNLAATDVLETARESRERLGVETIDLLYVHWPIRTYDPDETLPALDRLVDEGVVDTIGLSNFTPAQLEEAIDILESPVAAHQVESHPYLPQDELLALAREDGHALVAYTPLVKGRIAEDPLLQEIGDEVDATPSQVALAWLLERGATPIPKSTTPAHIRENYGALAVDLEPEHLERIDAIERRERVVDFAEAPWNHE